MVVGCLCFGRILKGEANFALNDWEAALKDFQNTVALDAANKAAKNKVRDIYFISFLFDE